MGLKPLVPWVGSCDYASVCVLPTWVLTIPCFHPSYLSHCGSFLVSVAVEIFSADLPVFLNNSYSVNNYINNSDVPVGRG